MCKIAVLYILSILFALSFCNALQLDLNATQIFPNGSIAIYVTSKEPFNITVLDKANESYAPTLYTIDGNSYTFIFKKKTSIIFGEYKVILRSKLQNISKKFKIVPIPEKIPEFEVHPHKKVFFLGENITLKVTVPIKDEKVMLVVKEPDGRAKGEFFVAEKNTFEIDLSKKTDILVGKYAVCLFLNRTKRCAEYEVKPFNYIVHIKRAPACNLSGFTINGTFDDPIDAYGVIVINQSSKRFKVQKGRFKIDIFPNRTGVYDAEIFIFSKQVSKFRFFVTEKKPEVKRLHFNETVRINMPVKVYEEVFFNVDVKPDRFVKVLFPEDSKERNFSIERTDNGYVAELNYTMPPPKKREREFYRKDIWVKRIDVYSNASIHYYNIPVETQIKEGYESYKLYLIEGNREKEVTQSREYNFILIDKNRNGLYDTAVFNIPMLSYTSLEIQALSRNGTYIRPTQNATIYGTGDLFPASGYCTQYVNSSDDSYAYANMSANENFSINVTDFRNATEQTFQLPEGARIINVTAYVEWHVNDTGKLRTYIEYYNSSNLWEKVCNITADENTTDVTSKCDLTDKINTTTSLNNVMNQHRLRFYEEAVSNASGYLDIFNLSVKYVFVKVDNNSYRCDAFVLINGTGFTPNSTVNITIKDPQGNILDDWNPKTVTSDSLGRISTYWDTYYANLTGNYTLNATDTVDEKLWDTDSFILNCTVNGTPKLLGYGYNFTVNLNSTDVADLPVINISIPNGTTVAYNMTNVTSTLYEFNFTDTWIYGRYNYTINYTHIDGTVVKTRERTFRVEANTTINVSTDRDRYSSMDDVLLKLASNVTDIGSTDMYLYLYMKVQYNTSSGWLTNATVVADSSKRNLSSSSYLNLSQIWSANGGWNTDGGKTGTYRVLVELKDPYGRILKNGDGTYMNNTYLFQILCYNATARKKIYFNGSYNITLFIVSYCDTLNVAIYDYIPKNFTAYFIDAPDYNTSIIINNTINGSATVGWRFTLSYGENRTTYYTMNSTSMQYSARRAMVLGVDPKD